MRDYFSFHIGISQGILSKWSSFVLLTETNAVRIDGVLLYIYKCTCITIQCGKHSLLNRTKGTRLECPFFAIRTRTDVIQEGERYCCFWKFIYYRCCCWTKKGAFSFGELLLRGSDETEVGRRWMRTVEESLRKIAISVRIDLSAR